MSTNLLIILIAAGALIGLTAALTARKRPSSGQSLNPHQLRALLTDGAVLILDVREAEEYVQGHIPGAVLLPLGQMKNRLREIPRDRQVVTVCLRGRRSRAAAEILTEAGFAKVSSLVGGMTAWPFEVERTATGRK